MNKAVLVPILYLVSLASGAAEVESLTIGLTSGGDPIRALHVDAGPGDAPRVAIVAGLDGTASGEIDDLVEEYAALADQARDVDLIAIPNANPERAALTFPPIGAAYRENAEAHTLWRWLGLRAPDLVIVVGDDPSGYADAIASADVAGVAPIPSARIEDPSFWRDAVAGDLSRSPAAAAIARRELRTPAQLADLLAPIYGQSFDIPIYIDGMGIIAHLNRGYVAHAEALAAPYVDGRRDSMASNFGVSSLVLAGHLVFARLAELTGDERYLERARAAADMAFDENGRMLEAMPAHGEMSDSVFMGAAILAAVGDLTGESRYFDMAARHIAFMNELVRRDDNLYRHSPLTDAAWARGNGFAAIGYALTLSKLPADHPAYARLMSEYRSLMQTLAGWQNDDGSFSQVVDHAAAYHETSSTAIIGFSMQRGLNRGWLSPEAYEDHVARAFRAVSARTDDNGGFIDVSESTNKQPSLDAYLMREALFGRDARTGSFALLFSVERAGRASGTEERTTFGPIGAQQRGLWLTDYRPGDPLYYDVEAIEFRPWARGLFDARQVHDLEPHARCKASGAIRQFLTPYGVEIVEYRDLKRAYIFDIGGPHTFREVFMDGRGHPIDIVPSNYGHNIGWWEGDTLVVDSVGYNEDFWFERLGLPHTESVQMTEFFRRTGAETVEYRFEMRDPAAYTAPVEGGLTLYWQDDLELFEFICQESNYAYDLMVNPEELRPIGKTSDIVP